jgi:hypothetical protein
MNVIANDDMVFVMTKPPFTAIPDASEPSRLTRHGDNSLAGSIWTICL